MDRAVAPSFAAAAARRRQRQRWAVRAGAALVVVLSLAYASLPLWLPADRVRLALELQLSEDIGASVRIGGLRVGWLQGVVLEDLTVADNTQAGESPLARVGQVRCDLSPFSLALGERVRVLEIVEPRIWLHLDENGRLQLPPFSQKRDSRLPSLNYDVLGLTCHVITPQVSQRFRIDRLDLQLDPLSGLLHLTSATRVHRPAPDADEPKVGRLDFDANIRIPRLKRSEPLNGGIEVEWSDLALNDLPVPLISHVPVEQVDGITSGRLSIETHPDLGIDYTVAIVFDGVRIMRPELNRPAQIPDAEVSCSGHWDPTAGLLLVRDGWYESPALRIESTGEGVPLLRVEENTDVSVALQFKGQVKDWQELRRELPEVDQAARAAGADLSGRTTFIARVERSRREDRASVQIDGGQSRWTVRRSGVNYLDVEAGVLKEVMFETVRERIGGRIRLPALALRIGDVQLDADGEVTLPPVEAAGEAVPILDQMTAALASLRAQVHLRCSDAANLRRWVPWLGARPEIDVLSGPANLDWAVDPQDDGTRITGSAVLPSESALRAGEMIRKHAGRSLRIFADARIPHASSGRVDLLNLDLRHGAGRLELASRHGSLMYDTEIRETPSGPVLARADGDWRTDLRIESVEDLVELSPLLAKRLQDAGVTFLAGGVETSGVGEFSYRPGDTLLRSRLHVIADNLAIRVRDQLTKRAGEAVSLDLAHHWRSGFDSSEHYWAGTLTGPAGKISGALLQGADPLAPTEPFELLTAQADVEEISDLLAAAPGLTDRIGITLSGGLLASLRQIRIGDWQAGTASIDGEQASFTLQPQNSGRLASLSGFHKPPDVAMNALASWESRPTADGAGRRVEIRDAQIQLAHAAVDHLEGRLVVPLAHECISDPAGPNAERFEVNGSIRLDEHLESLHPALREHLQRTSAQGTLSWRVGLEIGPEAIGIKGYMDATNASFRTCPDDTALSLIRKPAGEPLVATVDISCPRSTSATPGQIDIRHATLQLSGNSFIARGVLAPSSFADDRDLNSSLDVSADLPHLERIRNLLPNAPVESLEGGLLAEVSLLTEDGSVAVTSGRAELNKLKLGPAARPLRLDGSCTLADGALNLEQLNFAWGESRGALSGTLAGVEDRYEARVGFDGREVNVEDLLACIEQMQAGFPRDAGGATPDSGASGTDTAGRIVDLLRRTRATIDAQADTVFTPLPLGIKATFDAGWQRLDLRDGVASLDFGCLVDGGRVSGQLTADLNAADPTYRLTYTADRIQPGALVDAYLRRTFPGMIATGPLTLIDETMQKLTPAPGEPNPEIGRGELIIDGGTVSGRAAPIWMARIFPGLNLARFEFTRMHSWFQKTADSRVHHQMIYQGDYYHVYMIGWSNPEGFFQYEVGIDFLAGLESEYWANSGQGRVPLFTKSGQVRNDGSLADETVNFVSLRRVLETLFVGNNPVVTAYHAVRKRVLGQH